MSAETKPPADGSATGWGERLGDAADALQRLVANRLALWRAELASKSSDFARGAVGLILALLFGWLALLLSAALVAALLGRLFGSVIAGILAAFVLYTAMAAAAAILGWNRVRRVRPFDYPVTKAEVEKDLEALRRTAPEDEATESTEAGSPVDAYPRDVERRFREESE